MPKKKSAKTKTVVVPPEYSNPPVRKVSKRSVWKTVIAVLIVLFLVLLAANKGWVVAAVVNGKPIFSWQLDSSLRARYGQPTLEGLIGERLIADEARKEGIAVSDAELEAKQNEVLASLGADVNLDDFLKFQGLTKEDFQNQLKIQLTVERLLTKGLTITDEEIANYISTNGARLTATDPGKLKEEARQAIVANSVSEKLQSWFAELRQKASVMKFL